MIDINELKFDAKGLIPAIVVDTVTKRVLMQAYMNRESLEITMEKDLACFYSRSRQELWIKGMTSGHFQYVRELRIDCDNDTILAKVEQIGAACHTGNKSCFYRTLQFSEFLSTDERERNP